VANIYADDILTGKPAIHWPNPRVAIFFKKRWFYHPIFWLIYYTVFSLTIVFGVYQIRETIFYVQLIPIYLLDIALVYFNFYVLMPRFLARRKYFYYAFTLSLAIILMGFVNVALKHVYASYGSALFAITAAFNFTNIMAAITERFYAVILTFVIKIGKDSIQNQQRVQEREKQFLEAELNFLKSQIQPHFFFNTLNNLYSLTLKKSDQAPEVVLKLSELMSYMLYETNSAKVSLNKEIIYLQNYIDLEKLRFGKNLDLSFNIEEETDGVYLPPLVLILFIENSFKHGTRDAANNMKIDIRLKVEDGFLFFTAKNPVEENMVAKKLPGIGLKNAKRRLELIYGNNYSLEEVKAENEYTVSLKIPV